MHAVPSYLEIHVHGVDGQVAAFAQSDRGAIRKLLEQIQPGRLFTQRHLTIAGRQSLTLIPCAAVTRVDLVMEEPPECPRQFGVADALEVTEEEFRQRSLEAALPEPAGDRPGALFVIGVEIELTNGEQIFLEVHARARPLMSIDVGNFLQQILAAPSLHARRLGGGTLVINPAHILRMAFSPGPSGTPPYAWSADPLTC